MTRHLLCHLSSLSRRAGDLDRVEIHWGPAEVDGTDGGRDSTALYLTGSLAKRNTTDARNRISQAIRVDERCVSLAGKEFGFHWQAILLTNRHTGGSRHQSTAIKARIQPELQGVADTVSTIDFFSGLTMEDAYTRQKWHVESENDFLHTAAYTRDSGKHVHGQQHPRNAARHHTKTSISTTCFCASHHITAAATTASTCAGVTLYPTCCHPGVGGSQQLGLYTSATTGPGTGHVLRH